MTGKEAAAPSLREIYESILRLETPSVRLDRMMQLHPLESQILEAKANIAARKPTPEPLDKG